MAHEKSAAAPTAVEQEDAIIWKNLGKMMALLVAVAVGIAIAVAVIT